MDRYELLIKQNASRKTSGYGYIIDNEQINSYSQNSCVVWDLKFGKEITRALNLKNELSKRKRKARKNEIETIINKWIEK